MYRLVDSEGYFRYVDHCCVSKILTPNDKEIFYDKDSVVKKFNYTHEYVLFNHTGIISKIDKFLCNTILDDKL
jgi:hypothetical protein